MATDQPVQTGTKMTFTRDQYAELRMHCCEDPQPEVNQDCDDRTVWEIVCDSCGEVLAYIIAPESSEVV